MWPHLVPVKISYFCEVPILTHHYHNLHHPCCELIIKCNNNKNTNAIQILIVNCTRSGMLVFFHNSCHSLALFVHVCIKDVERVEYNSVGNIYSELAFR